MREDDNNRSTRSIKIPGDVILSIGGGSVAGAVVGLGPQIIHITIASELMPNVMAWSAFLLRIFSLSALLLRRVKPTLFLFSFTFALFIASAILANEFSAYVLPTLFLSLLVLVTTIGLSSTKSGVNRELLGMLYTWIFVAQLTFYVIIIYISRADVKTKGIILFSDVIANSVIICEFDQRIRFGDSCIAKVYLGKNTHESGFLYVIERILRRAVCLVMFVVRDLENGIFLGILVFLLLVPLVPLMSVHLMATASSFVAAIAFLVMFGARLRRECNIDLLLSLIPISPPLRLFQSKKKALIIPLLFVIIIIIAIYVIIVVLNQPLLLKIILLVFILSLILVLLLFFAIPFVLVFAIGNIVNIVGTRLMQLITNIAGIAGNYSQQQALLSTESNAESLISNLAFSSYVFMALIIFALITCLRHDIDNRTDGQECDLRALEPGLQACSGSWAVSSEEGEPRRCVERNGRSGGEGPRRSRGDKCTRNGCQKGEGPRSSSPG